ncbi:hypothetical protein F5Y08DRAFT_232914 [Xylaria arbuscula]|nr:hypothetical protein F5Y08DRAFT_232914 [Xylaria arbuscula]
MPLNRVACLKLSACCSQRHINIIPYRFRSSWLTCAIGRYLGFLMHFLPWPLCMTYQRTLKVCCTKISALHTPKCLAGLNQINSATGNRCIYRCRRYCFRSDYLQLGLAIVLFYGVAAMDTPLATTNSRLRHRTSLISKDLYSQLAIRLLFASPACRPPRRSDY